MGNNGSKLSAQEKAIFDLKKSRDTVHQYLTRLSNLHAHEHTRALAFLSGVPPSHNPSLPPVPDKPRALAALRRKHYYASLIAKTSAQYEQLQTLLDSIDQARIQKSVIDGLERGKEALEGIHKEMGGVERVERVMAQVGEGVEEEQRISEILGGGMADVDEGEVEEEFERLEAEAEKKETEKKRIAAIERGEPLPDAPRTELERKEDEALPNVPKAKLQDVAARQREEEGPMLA